MTTDDDIKQKVYSILASTQKIEFEPADERSNNTPEGNTLYLLDKEARNALIVLEREARAFVHDSDTKSALWKYVRFINPQVPARTYSVKKKSRHTQITDLKKVYSEIDSRYYFMSKRIDKATDELLSGEKLTQSDITKILSDAEYQKKVARAHKILIQKYQGSLDVRVTGVKHFRYYYCIKYKLYPINESDEAIKESKKEKEKHLSIDTPTALYYDAQESRIDENDLKFVKKSIDATFGDLFYVPKDKSGVTKEDLERELKEIILNGDED